MYKCIKTGNGQNKDPFNVQSVTFLGRFIAKSLMYPQMGQQFCPLNLLDS